MAGLLRKIEYVTLSAALLLLAASMVGRAAAQTSGCTGTLMNLSPCLNYITGNTSTPSSNCCNQLSTVVQSSPSCLCAVVNGAAASFGIAINQTLALSLPNACGITTPPLSQCQASSAPTGSPSPPESPVGDSPSEAPEASSTPSASDVPTLGGGSKSVPSTDGGSSDATKASINVALFLFFLLSCSSAVFTL